MRDPDYNSKLTQLFKLSSEVHKLQKSKMFCDITINVGEKTFRAHRVVLAASSEYFAGMLRSDFKESREATVTIEGTPEAFQILLDYAYSGELNLSRRTVLDVLDMSHYLHIDIVTKRCKSFLKDLLEDKEDGFIKVGIEEAVKIFSRADLFGFEELKMESIKLIVENFEASSDFLLCMTAELMETILDRDDLGEEKGVSLKFLTCLVTLSCQPEFKNQQEAADVAHIIN